MGERLSSVFSPDGTLISASAAPHCGGQKAGEWTGRVEISKEELPGSKCSMYGYILTYPRLKRENV